MCCAIIARIDRTAKAFLRPVAARPVFFVLTVLLGTAAPLAGQLIGGQSLKHYTLFTLSVCTVEAWLLCLLLQLLRQRVWRLAVQVLIYAYFGFFALVETGCVCLFDKQLQQRGLLAVCAACSGIVRQHAALWQPCSRQ